MFQASETKYKFFLRQYVVSIHVNDIWCAVWHLVPWQIFSCSKFPVY